MPKTEVSEVKFIVVEHTGHIVGLGTSWFHTLNEQWWKSEGGTRVEITAEEARRLLER